MKLVTTVASTALLFMGTACRPTDAATFASDPAAVVRAHLEAENAHDVERILATLADTLAMHSMTPDGQQSVQQLDRAGQRRTYTTAVTNAPDSHFAPVGDAIVSGPFVVSREEATGLPGGSREVGLVMYRVVKGRIVGLWLLNAEGVRASLPN